MSNKLYIKIKSIEQSNKGVIIKGVIIEGRLSIKQNVFLHNTISKKIFKGVVYDLMKNNVHCTQAKSSDKIVSCIVGIPCSEFEIGKSYIAGSNKPFKSKTLPSSNDSFTANNIENSIGTVAIEKEQDKQVSTQKISDSQDIGKYVPLRVNNNESSSVKEFKKCVNRCLKDGGVISPTEIYVLHKIAIALNIPDSVRDEIISSCKKQNDSAIQLYRDAVMTCLLDGNYLTETESCLLEKLRKILGISERVAYAIEHNSNWDPYV
jgi:hypothetical protein